MNISALDENGEPVDWWFAYKVPHLVHDAKTLNATGYEYLYYDPKVGKVGRSPNLLTDKKGAIDLTLQAVFEKPDDTTGWILYNDEMPKFVDRKDSAAFGHSKGVIAFDTETKTAYWLLHSWPKFAEPRDAKMPTPQYGQTYLCISLDLDTANQIATQMCNHQEPQVYVPRIPDSLDRSSGLYLLTQTLNPNAPGDADVIDCKSRGGLAFKVIAKNRKWDKDFWNEWVGPKLGENMRTETWIRGKIPPILDSDGVHKTFDVSFIDFRKLEFPWAWPETHDHAKWGITEESDWICVGDINRMISQQKRGGGTIAFQEPTLWAALSKTNLTIYPPGYKQYADVQALRDEAKTTEHESLAHALARKVKPKDQPQPKSGKKPAARKPKKPAVSKPKKAATSKKKKTAPRKSKKSAAKRPAKKTAKRPAKKR